LLVVSLLRKRKAEGFFRQSLCTLNFELCVLKLYPPSKSQHQEHRESTKHKPGQKGSSGRELSVVNQQPLCHNAFEVNQASLTKPRQPHKILRKPSCSRLDVHLATGLVNPTRAQKTGVVDMHYRFLRSVSGASKNAVSMVVRAFVTTLIIVSCVGLLMHIMGVPLPNIGDLWHGLGLSKLAKAFS